jgi:hypothetical protein
MQEKECSCASIELAKRRVSSRMITTDKINHGLEIRRGKSLGLFTRSSSIGNDESRFFHRGNTHFGIGANTRANCGYPSADSWAAGPKQCRSYVFNLKKYESISKINR